MKSKAPVWQTSDDIEKVEERVFHVIDERIESMIETCALEEELTLPAGLNDARSLLDSFKSNTTSARMTKRGVNATVVEEDMVLLARNDAGITPDILAQMKQKAKHTLPKQRVEEISALAEEVSSAYLPDKEVDVDALAKSKNIHVIYDHFKTAFDGALGYFEGEFFLYSNLDKGNTPGSARGRFTLAHELGHYFIDEHRNQFLCSPDILRISSCDDESRRLITEREADLFASHLLIPQTRFINIMRAPDAINTIVKLAADFHVSLECAAIRYVNSNITPCVILRWRKDGLAWKWMSRHFYSRGLRKTLDAVASIPADSATGQALKDDSPKERPCVKGTTTRFWFPFSRLPVNREEILIEESLSLGHWGALTLLRPQDSTAVDWNSTVDCRGFGTHDSD